MIDQHYTTKYNQKKNDNIKLREMKLLNLHDNHSKTAHIQLQSFKDRTYSIALKIP